MDGLIQFIISYLALCILHLKKIKDQTKEESRLCRELADARSLLKQLITKENKEDLTIEGVNIRREYPGRATLRTRHEIIIAYLLVFSVIRQKLLTEFKAHS